MIALMLIWVSMGLAVVALAVLSTFAVSAFAEALGKLVFVDVQRSPCTDG